MLKHILAKSRFLVALVVAGAMGTGAYAFTASNTVPASTAGSGSGVISGYTVSAVAYQLNATTPTNIDSTTFTLSASASTVKAKLVSASATYTACAVVGGTSVTCTFSPAIAITTANQLDVIAVS